MQRTRLLLLGIPLVVGVFYLRWLTSWRPQVVFKGQSRIHQLLFSKDGKTLLVGEESNNSVPDRLTSVDTMRDFRPNWTQTHTGWSWQFFADDTHILARGGGSGDLNRILDADNGAQFSQGPFLLWSTLSPDGRWLAYRTQARQETSPTSNAALFRQDALLAPSPYLSQTPSLSEWKRSLYLIAKSQTMACSVAFSPDSQMLAVGLADQTNGSSYIDLYDTRTRKRIQRWSDFQSIKRVQTQEEDVQWSPDGKLLLSYSTHDFVAPKHWAHTATLSLWRTKDGKRLHSRSVNTDNDAFPLSDFQLQNDGRVLAKWRKVIEDKGIVLDDIATLGPDSPLLFSRLSQGITAFALSPDGSYLLVGTEIGRVYRQRVK